MKKSGLILLLLAVALFLAGCATQEQKPTTPTPTPAQKTSWVWATLDPGGYGYRVIAGILDTVRADLPQYDFIVKPYSSTTAAIKGFCKGEADGTYIADLGFKELYTFTGAFKDFQPEIKQMPVQSFWTYTMETFILVPKNKANEIKSWKDLEGKKVYLTPAGYMNHINIRRALDAIGVKVEHVEVDSKFVCKAVEEGTIVATALYTTARVSLPTWGQELAISCKGKLVPLNPSPDEIEKLQNAGLQLVEIDAKVVDKEMTGTIYGVPFYFGYHAGMKISEDDVYKFLKAVEKNADKLPQVDAGLKPLAENVSKFQYLGIKSADPKLVPIHPGLAKYLREKGLWEAEWDKYIAK
ncbi:MAG: TAXI family TRAP transporter solute-binding subunit [Archaeoglobaceae archaeon]